MKNILLFLGIVLFLSACNDKNEDKTPTCQSLTTNNQWPTIDFKKDYTIQVPGDYKYNGYSAGFEGNTFLKASGDDKITLEAAFGTGTHFYDFGNVLSDTVPAQDQLRTHNGELMVLDHRESFCNNDEIVGYLYYSQWQVCNGQLYWKVNDKFQAALVLEFPYTELGTIKKIISTIKIKNNEM